MIITKFLVNSIETIRLCYRIKKTKVNLRSYRKIASIGKNFCSRPNDPLYGENLIIYNNNSRENIIIEDNVLLDCKIDCGKKGRVRIGEYTLIDKKTRISANTEIDIGKYCWIASDVLILDYDGHPESPELRKKQAVEKGELLRTDTYASKSKRIKINDCVLIATGAKIFKGVEIGYGSMVGAMAVVTNDIPSMSLAVGNPARVIRRIDENN